MAAEGSTLCEVSIPVLQEHNTFSLPGLFSQDILIVLSRYLRDLGEKEAVVVQISQCSLLLPVKTVNPGRAGGSLEL